MGAQKRTPAGVPTGGEFAGNEHEEAAAELSADQKRLALSFDLHPDYAGWTKHPGTDAHYAKPHGEKIIFDPYNEGWYAEDAAGDHIGSWTHLRDAIGSIDEREPRPVVPTPKDPTLEPRHVVPPIDEFDDRYRFTHPFHKGVSYGIKSSDHWGDFQVDTGYFGMQPRDHEIKPEHPLRWSSDQPTFERAAVVWQHRDRIDAALKAAKVAEHRRLRIEVESDRFVISEYDHGEFRDLIVPRSDV